MLSGPSQLAWNAVEPPVHCACYQRFNSPERVIADPTGAGIEVLTASIRRVRIDRLTRTREILAADDESQS